MLRRRAFAFRCLTDGSPVAISMEEDPIMGRVEAYEPASGWQSVDAVAMLKASAPAAAAQVRQLRLHLRRRGFEAIPVSDHIQLHPHLELALGRSVSAFDLKAAEPTRPSLRQPRRAK